MPLMDGVSGARTMAMSGIPVQWLMSGIMGSLRS